MPKFILVLLFVCVSINCKAQNSLLMPEERTFLVELLQASLAKFDKSIANLTEEQLKFRISSNKWTIAECAEHICLAELHFPQIVREELQKPVAPERRKKIKITNEKIIARLTNRRWKAKSPEIFKPSGKFLTIEETINAFRLQRNKTIDYVNTTNDDLRNHFWKHPATGVVDLYQTMILMSAHLERHTAQIEEIKAFKDFPK
jgi:uncharacterized damage-inducible protein DinB